MEISMATGEKDVLGRNNSMCDYLRRRRVTAYLGTVRSMVRKRKM
jgi:hypothetical protein